jgi:hypothetical protein
MNDDDKFRAQLDRAASDLDPTITARLRAARLHAVGAADARRGRALWWQPLSAAVAATLIAVTVGLLWWQTPEPLMTTESDDMELLLAREHPELFSEQLEFYDWLSDDGDAS